MLSMLSIPLGIIAIIVFIWSINSMDSKSTKGKKTNNSSMIGIVVGFILLFAALGLYDESSTKFFASENSSQEQGKATVRDSTNLSQGDEKNSASHDESKNKDNHKDKADENSNKPSDENLKEQQDAYQKWYNQLENRLQSIETTWSALWTDNSPEAIEKLLKSLEHEKTQLESLKIPTELSSLYRQQLTDAMRRYMEWVDLRIKVCQMHSSGKNQQDITNEIARGDGLKIRSNIEVSNVGRELGLLSK